MKRLMCLIAIFVLILIFTISGLWSEEIGFDHDYPVIEQLLKAHVTNGKVNYSALKNFPEPLDKIVQALEAVTPKEYKAWTCPQKKAFWINAYNMGAIKLVVDHYPLSKSFSFKSLVFPANSIQHIPNVWDKKFLTILNAQVSLNHIEHEILRKEFQDPRVHFSIVCASIGCPVLRQEPYVYHRLDEEKYSFRSLLNDVISP